MAVAKPTKPPSTGEAESFENFKDLTRKLIQVPKAEIDRKAQEYERQKSREKRGKPPK